MDTTAKIKQNEFLPGGGALKVHCRPAAGIVIISGCSAGTVCKRVRTLENWSDIFSLGQMFSSSSSGTWRKSKIKDHMQ